METEGLSLLRGKDFKLTDGFYVKHPKLCDIVDIGEDKYSEYLSCMCSTSVDVADILWFELKIWYEDIKDEWEFFLQKCLSNSKGISVKIAHKKSNRYSVENSCIAIGNSYRDALNFFFDLDGEYIIVIKNINGIEQRIIYNVSPSDDGTYILDEENNFKYTKFFYEMTKRFLDKINWQKRDYDFLHGGTKKAKRYVLENTLWRERNKTKKKKNAITLESIVSSLVAKGMPFSEVWNLPIYAVYNVYYRHFKINEYDNTITALYNGCIDTKKHPINWEKINWSTVIE